MKFSVQSVVTKTFCRIWDRGWWVGFWSIVLIWLVLLTFPTIQLGCNLLVRWAVPCSSANHRANGLPGERYFIHFDSRSFDYFSFLSSTFPTLCFRWPNCPQRLKLLRESNLWLWASLLFRIKKIDVWCLMPPYLQISWIWPFNFLNYVCSRFATLAGSDIGRRGGKSLA